MATKIKDANIVQPEDEMSEYDKDLTIDDFLAAPADLKALTKKVIIPRMNGSITVEAMTDEEFKRYQNRAKNVSKKGKVDFDFGKLVNMVAVNHIVKPNIKSVEFLERFGYATPDEFVTNRLLPGEIQEIYKAVNELSGFDVDLEDLIAKAKK